MQKELNIMIVTEEGAREYFREKYGVELSKDFHGIYYRWNEQDLEMAEKYLNGECFQDFTGIDFLEYVKEYNDKLLERHNNLSKETLIEIIETLRDLFETGILKQINYILFVLVMDYKFIYNSKLPDIPFDKYVIEKLKLNGNHKEWLGI
jgi:hypothetical protein